MPFDGNDLPDEISQLRDGIRRFVDREVRAAEAGLDPTLTELPKDVLLPLQAKARAAGYWMFDVPEKFGGLGLSVLETVVVTEEAVQYRHGLPNPIVFGKTPPAILLKGTPDQIERYVRPVVERGATAFSALSEPSGGSDPARAIRTTATRVDGGYVLNGEKLWASSADKADFGIVYARTSADGRQGITAFIVDGGSAGMQARPIQVLRNSSSAALTLTDCFVPEANRLGEEGQGFSLAQEFLTRGRLSIAARCIGVAEAAMRLAIEWAKHRETFGALLATRQAVQFAFADSAVELKAARLLTWDAAWKNDHGDSARHEASMAKLYASEAAYRVLDRMIQILGGLGLSREMPLESWYRSVRVWRIGEGPSEIQRFLIARDILGEAALGTRK